MEAWRMVYFIWKMWAHVFFVVAFWFLLASTPLSTLTHINPAQSTRPVLSGIWLDKCTTSVWNAVSFLTCVSEFYMIPRARLRIHLLTKSIIPMSLRHICLSCFLTFDLTRWLGCSVFTSPSPKFHLSLRGRSKLQPAGQIWPTAGSYK